MAKKKTGKKTTRARPVKRAAKRGPAKAAGPRKPPAKSGMTAKVRRAPAAGAPEIPGLQTGDIQETVRSVVGYVQQNPLGAAAVAIGVGVMLSSMYMEKRPATRGKRRAHGQVPARSSRK